jgi:UDP-3-O-[3-hydroxymyristoyl] glucosamine N-acyltransferase
MQQVSELFSQPPCDGVAIDKTAHIHPSASIGEGVHIGAHSVVGEGVVIHDDVRIGEHCVIEPFVTVGAGSVLSHRVVVHHHVLLGQYVTVQTGVVIGALPFAFQKNKGTWQAQAALGGVTVADNVHLGANMVIDRGTVGDTFIAHGVCIDNLVQVAHDAYIGDNTLIAGCAAIGAHAWIGADCIVGGGCGIASFVRLADDVVITGMSTVAKSILKSGVYSSGTMIHEHNRWRRNVARFKRLDDYMIKLTALARQRQVEDK